MQTNHVSVTPVYYGKLHQITEKLLKVIKSLGFGETLSCSEF